MKNKIISLSLITSLLCQSSAMAIQIASSGPLSNALSNYTPAKMIESKDSTGKVIKTNYYSGGYYFRFSNESYPQPLWQVSPPSIEAGCNGFNMKGMFVSILGLDQFGAMLQNAGAALAWGIAIGLIYSLPGVAAAFKMINQWAQEIQKLLSMSCSSGMAIGQAIGKKVGEKAEPYVNDVKKSITDALPSPSVPEFAQNGKKAISDAFGSLDLGLSASWDTGITFSGTNNISEDKRAKIFAKIGSIFGDYSIGGSIYSDFLNRSPKTRLFLNKEIKNPITSPISYKLMTITYNDTSRSGTGSLTNFGGIDLFEESVLNMQNNLVSVEDKDVFGFKMLSYILLYNLVGDFGYGKDNVSTFVNETGKSYGCSSANSGPKPAACEPIQTNDKKVMDALTEASAIANINSTFVGEVRPANGKQLLNFVENGYDSSFEKSNKTFKAPSFIIIVVKENGLDDNYTIIPTDPISDTKAFKNGDFPGMKAIAQCSLYKALYGKIPESYYEDLKNISTGPNSTPVALNCDSIPNKILLPGIDLYTDLLYKATETEIADGVKLLKDFNTYLSTLGMLDHLTNNISMSKIGSPKLSNSNQANQGLAKEQPKINGEEKNNLNNRLLAFTETVKDAKKTLKDDYPQFVDGQEKVDRYFKYVKEEIAKRSIEKQR